MRLLYTSNDLPGFHRHRLPLVKRAMEAGYSVHVAAPPNSSTPNDKEGLIHHEIPLSRRGMHPLHEAGTVRALVRLYKELEPDLVHHMTIKPVLYGSAAARLARTPAVVNTVTGLGYAFLAQGVRGRLLRSGVKAGYRVAFGHPNQRVVFQNPDDMRKFLESGLIREEDSRLIQGSGVDLGRFKPLRPSKDQPPLVVLPSRMLFDKGVVEFVEAVRLLRKSGLEARFALVGDSDPGNPAAIPREKLKEWDDEGHVEWWGWRDDIQEVYREAHIVCLPSYREGVPRALMEAAASARPVVTTDAPGCREAVRHEENGLLVPVKDHQELAHALRRLIEDPSLRERMGQAGRSLAEAEFDENKIIAETLAVYQELTRSTRTTQGPRARRRSSPPRAQ